MPMSVVTADCGENNQPSRITFSFCSTSTFRNREQAPGNARFRARGRKRQLHLGRGATRRVGLGGRQGRRPPGGRPGGAVAGALHATAGAERRRARVLRALPADPERYRGRGGFRQERRRNAQGPAAHGAAGAVRPPDASCRASPSSTRAIPRSCSTSALRGPAGRPDRARPRHRGAGGQPERFPLHHARAEPRTAGDGGVARLPEAPRRAADARRSRGAQLHRLHLRSRSGRSTTAAPASRCRCAAISSSPAATPCARPCCSGSASGSRTGGRVRHDLAVGSVKPMLEDYAVEGPADQRRLSADPARAAQAARDDRFPGRDHPSAAGAGRGREREPAAQAGGRARPAPRRLGISRLPLTGNRAAREGRRDGVGTIATF